LVLLLVEALRREEVHEIVAVVVLEVVVAAVVVGGLGTRAERYSALWVGLIAKDKAVGKTVWLPVGKSE
jgi:hypothetical protein